MLIQKYQIAPWNLIRAKVIGGLKRCSVWWASVFFAESVCVLGRVYELQSRGEYVHGQLAGLSSG